MMGLEPATFSMANGSWLRAVCAVGQFLNRLLHVFVLALLAEFVDDEVLV
jgi:hypothetical protein